MTTRSSLRAKLPPPSKPTAMLTGICTKLEEDRKVTEKSWMTPETLMPSIAEHREVSVREAMLLHPENGVANAIGLGENLAKIIFPLIGQHNFEYLFSRSLHLHDMTYAGMVPNSALVERSAYPYLHDRLRGHGIDEQNLASIGLLNTFIDTLILLLGEGLTEKVLNPAWQKQRAGWSPQWPTRDS